MMVRYGFNIRTRSGQRVDNISIMAASRGDAERRLRQMYQKCEVVECQVQAVAGPVDALDLPSVIERLSASEPPAPLPPVGAAPSLKKAGTH
jgi:hypothetical protein